jgi:hypothetical protein
VLEDSGRSRIGKLPDWGYAIRSPAFGRTGSLLLTTGDVCVRTVVVEFWLQHTLSTRQAVDIVRYEVSNSVRLQML